MNGRDKASFERGAGVVARCASSPRSSAVAARSHLARPSTPAAKPLAGCRIYVASGDDIPNGHDLNDDAKRYPEKLLEDHLKSPGWCLYNQGKNGQTSSAYISGGGLSNAYNMRPDLLTIQLGEQNTPIVNLITSCFDKVKDHDFTGRERVRGADPRQLVASGRT